MPLIIAGERSGVGKTTVTLALLAALKQQKATIQSFKVGPDYIDPMFHQSVTGRPCRNLDPRLTSEAYVQHCFATHSQTTDFAVIEGVMGLFDGAADQPGFASTAHIARLLDLPILLVLDCARMSHSIAALLHGYLTFDPALKFAGVVLNQVGSDRHLEILKTAIAPLQIPILGVLRREDAIQIPDRHLGLVPTDEMEGLTELFDRLAQLGQTCFDWQNLREHLTVKARNSEIQTIPVPKIRIAIAQDAAFNFYYADNLDLLKQRGAELIPWSPLQDDGLPDTIQGLYLGGGFPEMFAATLSENLAARNSIKSAIAAGLPTYAECGGLMYLCESLVNFSGESFPMVGSLPTTTIMGSRLTLGYRQGIALQDTPLVKRGDRVQGHEFHKSQLAIVPQPALFDLGTHLEGWCLPNLHASYVHLHWGATPNFVDRFLHQCSLFPVLRYPCRELVTQDPVWLDLSNKLPNV
jgi:cobyrinic acid a,c-diamide synthase